MFFKSDVFGHPVARFYIKDDRATGVKLTGKLGAIDWCLPWCNPVPWLSHMNYWTSWQVARLISDYVLSATITGPGVWVSSIWGVYARLPVEE